MRRVEPEIGSWSSWYDKTTPPVLGVSSCLLGSEVRFDGGHKRDRFLVETLGRFVTWSSVCPEQEMELGVPRPTMRLAVGEHGPRLIVPSQGNRDLTEPMQEYARERVRGLRSEPLDGYVLKKGSPSCGMERIKVFSDKGMPVEQGMGLFARELRERWPDLPVEEEGRLHDAHLLYHFLERVFCFNRWRVFVARGPSRKGLVEFHTAHKMLLRAHDEARYQVLGRLVARSEELDDAQLFARYREVFGEALEQKVNRKRNVNVLQHARGYLKEQLPGAAKAEVDAAIEDYRAGFLPLIVPVSLVRTHAVAHGIDYLLGQLYFDPHPRELMLRNRI